MPRPEVSKRENDLSLAPLQSETRPFEASEVTWPS